MAVIRIPPEIVDKALAVRVDEGRAVLAVWMGRGRIDLYDFGGTWHETSHPYSRHEEGLWSRDDVLGAVAETLTSAQPRSTLGSPLRPTIKIDAEELNRAQLVRARPLAYALWHGGESVEFFSGEGMRLRSVRVPSADLVTMSQLMHDMLEVCELVVELRDSKSRAEHLTAVTP